VAYKIVADRENETVRSERTNLLGSKLFNMIAFNNLQLFSETIGNCDKSLCLHTKINKSDS
jgi:hypothetical protein